MDEIQSKAQAYVLYKRILKEIEAQKQSLIDEMDEIITAYDLDVLDKMDYPQLQVEFERIKNERIECCILRSHLRLKTSLKKTVPDSKLKVVQLDKKTGEVIRMYETVRQAADEICKRPEHLHKCVRHKIKTAYGFVWRYREEYEKHKDEQGKYAGP